MKKTYVKPGIEFVNFRMGTSIAANCTLKAEQADENSCSYDMRGFEVFTNCEYQATDFDLCYHVPTADKNVFAS